MNKNSLLISSLLVSWFKVVLWMGLIFLLSGIPSLKSPLQPMYDFPLRKLAHILEYGVLAILILRAFGKRITNIRFFAFALTIAVLYAMTDEWHQTFVYGRHGAWTDVAIDSVGIIAALIYAWLYLKGSLSQELI